jgi:NAD+ kinase
MPEHRLASTKVAGFVLKPEAPEISVLFHSIREAFEQRGIGVLLSENSARMIGQEGVSFEVLCERADFLVSLGGDGTLLSLVRRSYGYHKPVLGINAGKLGFLADIKIDEVEQFLDNLQSGHYRIDERMMIEGEIVRDEMRQSFYAFNDVVITRPTISKMVKIDASFNGEWFNTYRGDGLIIATPTGSTAYNLAAGGPVIYPLTEAFIMTPICPHALTQRPLVAPVDFTIALRSPEDKVVIMVDGQDDYELETGSRLYIKGATIGARLLHRQTHNYFSVLRDKLYWGQNSIDKEVIDSGGQVC